MVLKSGSVCKTWMFFEQWSGRDCLLVFEIQKPVSVGLICELDSIILPTQDVL